VNAARMNAARSALFVANREAGHAFLLHRRLSDILLDLPASLDVVSRRGAGIGSVVVVSAVSPQAASWERELSSNNGRPLEL
jgi:hypothetical protein